MSHNTIGHLFRVTTWGESHGPSIGCVIDGCPPGIALAAEEIQAYLDKRRPGQSRFTTQRREPDAVRILSGVFARRCRPPGDHGHADLSDHRQRRPARPRLHRHQGQVPARSRGFHLLAEIRHPRLPGRRALLGTRDGDARCRRGRRPQGHPERHDPRRAGADRPAQDRPVALELGGGRQQSVLLARTPVSSRRGRATWTRCARPAPPWAR